MREILLDGNTNVPEFKTMGSVFKDGVLMPKIHYYAWYTFDHLHLNYNLAYVYSKIISLCRSCRKK